MSKATLQSPVSRLLVAGLPLLAAVWPQSGTLQLPCWHVFVLAYLCSALTLFAAAALYCEHHIAIYMSSMSVLSRV